MSLISDNPQAAKDFMDGISDKARKATKVIIDNFHKHLPGLTEDQYSQMFSLFSGLLGSISEEPEIMLDSVSAFTILTRLEKIFNISACLAYPEYQKPADQPAV